MGCCRDSGQQFQMGSRRFAHSPLHQPIKRRTRCGGIFVVDDPHHAIALPRPARGIACDRGDIPQGAGLQTGISNRLRCRVSAGHGPGRAVQACNAQRLLKRGPRRALGSALQQSGERSVPCAIGRSHFLSWGKYAYRNVGATSAPGYCEILRSCHVRFRWPRV